MPLSSRRLFFYNIIAAVLPEGLRFRKLRNRLLRWCGAEIGDDVYISKYTRFEGGGYLIIGDRTWIGRYTFIAPTHWRSTIKIGSDCKIAHMVSMRAETHKIEPASQCIGGGMVFGDITIGNGVWVCANAIILPDVEVAEKCIIAAGAVVTKSCPAYSLVAGVPGVVKKRYK